MAKSITDAVATIYDLFKDLPSEERVRIVQAVFSLLGDSAPTLWNSGQKKNPGGDGEPEEHTELPAAATRWMKQHSLSMKDLEPYFHFEAGGVSVIDLPDAKTNREKTAIAYLFQGVANLLSGGSAAFTDEQGRDLCKEQGVYDRANHTTYCKKFENKIAGSATKGWKVTAPGLDEAAKFIKPSEE
jgi:hypothetical protein